MGKFKDEIVSQSKSGCDFYHIKGATCDKKGRFENGSWEIQTGDRLTMPKICFLKKAGSKSGVGKLKQGIDFPCIRSKIIKH